MSDTEREMGETELPQNQETSNQNGLEFDVGDPEIQEILEENPVVRRITEENGKIFDDIGEGVDPEKLEEAKFKSALLIIEAMGIDPLVEGLYNKRGFNKQLEIEVAQAERSQLPLSVLIFDVDDFKKINDQFGLYEGDATLRRIGQATRDEARMTDIPARWGGDEYGVILPDTNGSEAVRVALRLLKSVPKQAPDFSSLTISIGIAELYNDSQDNYENHVSLFKRADIAKQWAKETGKDQIVLVETGSQNLSLEKLNLNAADQKSVTLIHT